MSTEAAEFVRDLVRQLPRVTHDQRGHLAVLKLKLLQNGDRENGRLTHAGFRLAEDVAPENSLRNALMLD